MAGPVEIETQRILTISVTNQVEQTLTVESFPLGGDSEWSPPPPDPPYRTQKVEEYCEWKTQSVGLASSMSGNIVLSAGDGGTVTISWKWPKGKPISGNVAADNTTGIKAACQWYRKGRDNPVMQVSVTPPGVEPQWPKVDDRDPGDPAPCS